jgi:hypothetical protein
MPAAGAVANCSPPDALPAPGPESNLSVRTALSTQVGTDRERTLQSAALGLQPLIQTLVWHDVAANDLGQLVKWLFVKETQAKLRSQGTRVSISRIAAATGLTRAEVGQLLRLESTPPTSRPWQLQRSHRVVIGWRSDPDFLDSAGNPRALRFAGQSPTFCELCARYSGDIPPRAMLQELIDSGQVLEAEEVLQLCEHQQATSASYVDVHVLGAALGLLGGTICHNARAPNEQKRHFETVSLDDVPAEARPRIRRELARRCRVFAGAIQRYLLDEAARIPASATRSAVELGVVLALFEDDRGVAK